MRARTHGMVVAALLAAAAWGLPATALADARIAVRLTDHEGRPVDGTVTLTAGDVTRSCRTTASRCTLSAPAGTYTVTMRPNRGTPPASRTLRVPASGTISLALTAGAPTATVAATATATTTATRIAPRTSPTTQAAPTGTSPVTRQAVRARPVRRAVRPRTSATTAAPTFRFNPAVRVDPTAGGDGTTSGGSGSAATTTTPTATTTAATTAVQTRVEEGRDLTRGARLVVQGRVLDGAGRPTDATITLRRSGELVGTAETTAGSFSMYDLDAGTYDVSLRSSRGTSANSRLTVGSTTSRVTLRVP